MNMKMKKLEKIFKALANKRRLEVLSFLSKTKRASVGEIAEKIQTSTKSTSKHLLVLYHAEFLEKERVRGLTFYELGSKLGYVEKVFLDFVRRQIRGG